MSTPQVAWDSPGQSAPPQVKWDAPKPAAPNAGLAPPKEGPGFLDKEIPHDSYGNATLSGIQSLGRGVRSAAQGAGRLIAHPIDTAGEMFRSAVNLPYEASEIPAAIHDINQSPDPISHYGKAAQDTAGDAFGQDVLALATEGAARAVPPVARGVSSVAKPALKAAVRGAGKTYNAGRSVGAAVAPFAGAGEGVVRLVHGDPAGALYSAVSGGMVGKAIRSLPEAPESITNFGRPRFTNPGAHLPEIPSDFIDTAQGARRATYPGAHLPENPGPLTLKPTYPGAHLPEAPPVEVGMARGLRTGAKPVSDPVAGLGEIPVRDAAPGKMPPAQITRPSADSFLDRLRANAARIKAEGHGEIPDTEESAPITTNLNEDLTPALKKSLAKVRAAKRIANSKSAAVQ